VIDQRNTAFWSRLASCFQKPSCIFSHSRWLGSGSFSVDTTHQPHGRAFSTTMGSRLETKIPQPGSWHPDERWMPCLDHGLSTTGTNHPEARFQNLLLRRGTKTKPHSTVFLIFSAQMVEKRNLRGMFRTSFGPRLLFFSSQTVEEGLPIKVPPRILVCLDPDR
jgi:hypothetical protein